MHRKDALRRISEPSGQLIDPHWKPIDKPLAVAGSAPASSEPGLSGDAAAMNSL